jgi:hypothetical protein
MRIENIRILDEIVDSENDSIDVCVDGEDGYTYTISICTIKYILRKMDQENSNFCNPRDFVIIVRRLTPEIIAETIKVYSEDDGFWLKLHHFVSEIDISVFDKLKAKHVKDLIESDLLSGLDDLEDEINKFDNLNNSQKSNLTARIEKLAKLLLD